MKKQIDINSYISESEFNAFTNPKKDSYERYQHKFVDNFLSYFSEKVLELNFNLQRANHENLELLSQREQYTIKKESLEYMMGQIFKMKNKDFLKSSELIKITGSEDNILSKFLNKKEKAYITLNVQPMEFIKLSKSSKIVDYNFGEIYTIKDQYQQPITLDYPCFIDEYQFSIQYPLYINILIVSEK